VLGGDVVTDIDPIAKKLAPMLRMLADGNDGQAFAAMQGLRRALQGDQAKLYKDKLYDLAEHAERPDDGGLSEQDMQKVFDAGVQEGMRRAENKLHGSSSGDFRNTDGTPEWLEIARYCQQHDDRLREEKERQFVADMAGRLVFGREPTERQGKWLLSIFYRLGGKLAP
jgi:hypothetical protein